jgi:propionyl-CoA synthetase
MDAGYKDENGYVFVTARDDDVINVAGHRISTSSLEDAVLRHPDVADAAGKEINFNFGPINP